MFLKMIAVIVFALLLGAVLLGLRQHRLDTMHAMTAMHSRINQLRESMWTTQSRIARHLEPSELRGAIERAQLDLEPITETNVSDDDEPN